ncbi:4'-phosphopantetheinyl transferase [Arthrobacter crystallopoietes BAB-32]|uniref:4'-phosphopantetheinyl transferase n=1 Tax=Arthrobacter crystallopoietes BAB-32 TaxID=1246476 RepID=N1V3N4_9MICC|nr:4'-phosphopantetheinyl transferase superfamily protein [Arthrobacter crystallopoietes]EMY35965.1 4'-phosphopantetheinyl transferase [Arthrobacter crystallopoietes BAB-32]
MKAEVILRLVHLDDEAADHGQQSRRDGIRRRAREAVLAMAAEELDVPLERLRLVFHCRDCQRGDDGNHGQPQLELDGAPAPVRLSYSRHGEWLLAALIFRPVLLGVDLEDTASDAFGELDNIDSVALTDEERVLVESSDSARLLRARLWIRKEALLKSTGHGLRLAPDTVGVADGDGNPSLVLWPGDAGERPGIRLLDVELPTSVQGVPVPATLAAALAVGGSSQPGITFREALAKRS